MSLIRWLSIASLSLVSASAMAGAYSSASLSGLSFTLFDLDSTDGITASYTLTPATSETGKTSVRANASVLGAIDSQFDSSNVQLAPLAEGASIFAPWGAFAHSSADVSSTDLRASGMASGANTSYLANASVGYYYFYQGYNIELTPNTKLVVSVTAQASAWAGNAECTFLGCTQEKSLANADMSLSYFYKRDPLNDSTLYGGSSSTTLNASAVGYSRPQISNDIITTGDYSEHKEQVLSGVFINNSNVIQSAALQLTVAVSGSATTAVPETSTLAMFGLGLAGMAMSGARRTRSRRSAQS